MVGEGLAANLGIAPGDKIILLANTAKGTVNAREVTVRGIFATVSKFNDDVALRIPIRAAQELLRVTGAQQWLVFLDKTERTTEVLQALESMPMAKQMAFTRWDQDADFYHKTAELFARQFGFARAVIAVIIVLSILNSMTMNVLERTQEVGVMLALGDPRRHILSVFTWEGTLLGLLGGILGAVIGIIVALILNALGIPLPPPPGMSHGFNAGVVVTGPLVAGAATVGIVATVLASLPPAYRASRLLAVEALRHGK
jgi:putative ABC transport system permease protein